MNAKEGPHVDDRGLCVREGAVRARHDVRPAGQRGLHLERLRRTLSAEHEGRQVQRHAVLEKYLRGRVRVRGLSSESERRGGARIKIFSDREVVRRERALRQRVAPRRRHFPLLVELLELEAHLLEHRLLRPRERHQPICGFVHVRVRRERRAEVEPGVERAAVVDGHAARGFRAAAHEVEGLPARLERRGVELVRRSRLPQSEKPTTYRPQTQKRGHSPPREARRCVCVRGETGEGA